MATQNDSWNIIKNALSSGKQLEIIISDAPKVIECDDKITIAFSAWEELNEIFNPNYDYKRAFDDTGDYVYNILNSYGYIIIKRGELTEANFDKYGKPYLQVKNERDLQHVIADILYCARSDFLE